MQKIKKVVALCAACMIVMVTAGCSGRQPEASILVPMSFAGTNVHEKRAQIQDAHMPLRRSYGTTLLTQSCTICADLLPGFFMETVADHEEDPVNRKDDAEKEQENLFREEVSEEISGSQARDELDADRIIEEQSFQVELNDWGEVRFVSYEPAPAERNPDGDVTFYLLKDAEILYQFPYIGEGHSSGYGYYWDVKFVMFMDTNDDGKEDIVIGPEYMTGAGPQGAVPHTRVRIYEDCGDYFTYNEELSNRINDYLPWEGNVLAADVKRLIRLTGTSGSLTDYESYTGIWQTGTEYVAAYENPYPAIRKELTCSISNGNEFDGALLIEQETAGRAVSVENITGTIRDGELLYEFADDSLGGKGTLRITFLPNQINVEVLDYQAAEGSAAGSGIAGNYEMTIRKE